MQRRGGEQGKASGGEGKKYDVHRKGEGTRRRAEARGKMTTCKGNHKKAKGIRGDDKKKTDV